MSRFILLLLTLSLTLPAFSQTAAERKRMVAVLDLRDRNQEDNTRLYGTEQIAIAAGFPFITTKQLGVAATYGMILSSSDFNSSTFTNQELDTLRSFVSAGGILVTSNMKDYRLNDVFGVTSYVTARDNYTLNFRTSTNDSALVWFDQAREKETILGKSTYSEVLYTRHFELQNATALAYFNNDPTKAAITKNKYGNGYAYNLGYSLRDVSLRHQLNYDYTTERDFSNGFEPNADVHILLLRAIFAEHGTAKVWKHTSIANSYSTVMVTHDIDSRTGMDTMLLFSDWEKQVGIVADYNVTTRYFADSAMSDFYAGKETKVEQVKLDGHNINSHSVGHFYDFHEFDMGPWGLNMSTYLPFYNGTNTVNGYVLPELQVSKNILESNHNVTVETFRAGHLRYPDKLPNVLDTLGYRYESSLSTNDLGWSFPFPLKKDRTFSGEITNVYEISMTLSDVVNGGIDASSWPGVVDGWVNNSFAYADNYSPVNLLIHPNRTWKLTAEQTYLARLGNKFYRTNMATYGDYWRMRKDVSFTSKVNNDTLTIFIANSDYPLDPAMSFMAEGSDVINEVIVQTNSGIQIPMSVEQISVSNRMIIYNEDLSVGTQKTVYSKPNNIQVYPNPSSGEFTVELANYQQKAMLTVFDLTGRIIKEETFQGQIHRISLDPNPGIYLLRISNQNGEIGTKFIVVK